MATLYKPDGSKVECKPKKGKSFTLEEWYALIECDMVQPIYLPDGRVMLVDEEAKLKAKVPAHNELATKLLILAGGLPYDHVVGNALIVSREEFG